MLLDWQGQRNRKHDLTFDDYKEIVAKVQARNADHDEMIDASCAACGFTRKQYNYARQMVRRGRPLAEQKR